MNETGLVRAAARGDDRAFAALARRHERRLYATAHSIAGSGWDAADAVQEGLLEAWTRLDTLRDPDGFRAWVTRIVVNKCHDQHRRARRLVLVDEPPDDRASHEWVGPESALDLAAAVRALDDDHRTVVALRYFADLKVDDIAAILEVPAGTVKSRINRALGRLRASLEPEPTEVPR